MKARHIVVDVILYDLLAGSATAVMAQVAPQYNRQFRSVGIDHVTKIVADPAGNVYVAGYTKE